MHTHTFYRASTVSSAQAIEDLLKRYPGAEIAEFVTKIATADDATKGRVSVGTRIFKATLKTSEEFGGGDEPPASDDAGDSESKPEPKAEKSEGESKPKPEGESKEPSGEPGDSADDGGDELGGDLDAPKMKPEEEMVHLLKQILDAVGGGAGPLGPDAGPGGPDDILQVGAPGKGEALPPPHGAPHGPPHGAPPPPGPGGPMGHGGPPLPPPVDKSAGPGMAFAKAFSVKRAGVKEIGTRALIAEAQTDFPHHKVARVLRNGTATVDGYKVNLPENDLALITLVAK